MPECWYCTHFQVILTCSQSWRSISRADGICWDLRTVTEKLSRLLHLGVLRDFNSDGLQVFSSLNIPKLWPPMVPSSLPMLIPLPKLPNLVSHPPIQVSSSWTFVCSLPLPQLEEVGVLIGMCVMVIFMCLLDWAELFRWMVKVIFGGACVWGCFQRRSVVEWVDLVKITFSKVDGKYTVTSGPKETEKGHFFCCLSCDICFLLPLDTRAPGYLASGFPVI